MRKIILQLAITLDGFIEGPLGEFDWCFTDQDYGMTPFLESIDTVFYGRKSFDLVMKHGNPFANKKTVVFSRSVHPNRDGVEFVSDNLHEYIQEVIKQPGKNIWLFGGADLLNTFLKEGWVDEIHLAFHPLLLGAGKPLFQNLPNRVGLRLLNSQAYNTGLVMMQYEIKKDKQE